MVNKKTLNEYLFDQLESLSTANVENIDLEITKAASIISVAEKILDVAKLKLEIIQAKVSIEETFTEIDSTSAGLKKLNDDPEVNSDETLSDKKKLPA